MPNARIAILWEKHSYSRIVGETFADVRGVGRFSIRKAKSGPGFSLKLNGKHICSAEGPSSLQQDAQKIVASRMKESRRDMDE